MANWKEKQFADSHNELNKSYFDKKITNTLIPFIKFIEALEYIMRNSTGGNFDLLDVGCGAGWYGRCLYDNFCDINYHGIDFSSYMIEYANQNVPEGVFLCENPLVFNSNKVYDIVMESALLELIGDYNGLVDFMIGCSNKWIIFHRLFVTEKNTYTDNVETYNNIEDIRTYINYNELCDKMNHNNFKLVNKCFYEKDRGTFIFEKIK